MKKLIFSNLLLI